MTTTEPADVIGTRETCQILGVSKEAVRLLVNAGTLPLYGRITSGPHGAFLFRRGDVEELARQRAQASA